MLYFFSVRATIATMLLHVAKAGIQRLSKRFGKRAENTTKFVTDVSATLVRPSLCFQKHIYDMMPTPKHIYDMMPTPCWHAYASMPPPYLADAE